MKFSVSSPAKINLFFRILGRRENGFHQIASLYQAISLCDQLDFELAEEDQFFSTDPSVPMDASNLVVKALHIFREHTQKIHPLSITLHKKIPVMSGLGGGSSNAASTLWALNHLFATDLPVETLMDWGAVLGSDISFFFSSGTAYCQGKGEEVTECSLPCFKDLWIVKPDLALSTPKVYEKYRTYPIEPGISPELLLNSFFSKQPQGVNDLEKAAFELLPELADIKKYLYSLGFSLVCMTGSGTAFWCWGDPSSTIEWDTSFLKSYRVTAIQRASPFWYL